MTMTTYSVLFVCMGNICRSPTAHGVFGQKVIDQGLAHWVAEQYSIAPAARLKLSL